MAAGYTIGPGHARCEISAWTRSLGCGELVGCVSPHRRQCSILLVVTHGDTRQISRGFNADTLMPIVYYDEEDIELGDELSSTAIFLVCFELAMLFGVYYAMFAVN